MNTPTAECWGGPWDGRREPVAIALGEVVRVLEADHRAFRDWFYWLTTDNTIYRWVQHTWSPRGRA